MAQTTLNPKYNNKTLFSNYYLDNKVKTSAEWKKNDHIAAFSEIKEIYDKERKSFENFNEAQLIKHFLDPIFKSLFFESEVEEAAGSEFPDYAFFRDKTSRDEAHKNKGTISFYTNALAIGEVKKWDKELDGKPIHQLRNYLDVTEKKWGILTNGRKWRLFCKEKKRDEYYEIDLPALLDTNDIEGFKYFFYFFRRDAFLLPENFLEQVLRESEDHAKAIGNNLKENVYKAMKKIADGFFGRPQNTLDKNNVAAQELVQKNTMLLLYRLLFLLYAEDRNLLDVTKPKYLNNHSFRRIKKEVEEKRGRTEQGYDNTSTSIWDRLKNLFDLINLGSEAFGETEFHVPAYNGGLFDTTKNPELVTWKIGDKYLAEAIHLLTWSGIKDGGFVDYSELEIRHLGSIYEGLLEYKLKVAESDIVTKENEWVSLEKYNEDRKQKKVFDDFDEFSRTRNGELYLATDKGERKATGSYYTPDYIVNYIVRNTVGPVIDEKWKDAEAKKQSFVDATLSVKVLDPAMGSGHFLVGAVEFLAEKLLKAAQKDIEAGRIVEEARFSDQDWARREVVAHCIYGVDLNPMAVELAKVGLWLTTISKEKPLSFLDHRLKQGNSLIGARLSDLNFYPDLKKKAERSQTKQTVLSDIFIDQLLGKIKELEKISDEKLEDIKKKERIFKEFKELDEYKKSKAIANIYTAVFFGNEVTPSPTRESKKIYYDLIYALDFPSNWAPKVHLPWFKQAQEIALEKSFFHWELEFPEIFFEGGAPKDAPGWDAVVGNPPYFSIATLPDDEKQYLSNGFSEVFAGNSDILYYFMALSVNICARNRYTGYIIGRYFQESKYGAKLRKYLSSHVHLLKHADFLNYQVFGADVNVLACISVYQNKPPEKDSVTLVTKITDDKATTEEVSEALLNPKSSLFEKLESPSPYFTESDWKFLSISLKKLEERFKNQTIPLDEIATVVKSMETGKNEVLSPSIDVINKFQIEQELVHPIAKSGSIIRYRIEEEKHQIIWTEGIELSKYPKLNAYLMPFKEVLSERHDIKARNANWWEISNPRNANLFFSDYPRILVPFIATGNKFCVDTEKHLNDGGDLRAIFFNKESKISPYYVCAILNSKAGEKYHKSHSKLKRGGYYEYYEEKLSLFPIRRISFTTPPARRAALFEEAKALYSAEAPDSQKLLDFVGARLEAKPEESDVVHDLLAHLAERMIEMNKKKNAEIKGFLDFLKGEIGASIDDLSNKTAIQEYYRHEFQTLIDVLVKNKKKLKAGYDPKNPNNYKILKDWYNDSADKLAPLMRRIEATDGLIDAIVYRLYGLTEDEINIVEGSISGEKNAEGSKT